VRVGSVLLISLMLYSSLLRAQKVSVPFVGCPSDGQLDAVEAPNGTDKVVQLNARAAQKLAYYKAPSGYGVLAPRGWHCLGAEGSSSASLFVSPQPKWSGTTGSAIQVVGIDGSGSGASAVAEVLARVFPAYRAFVQNVIDAFDLPAGTYTFGPFPSDKLVRQTSRLVEFHTPPHSEGLGTMDQLKAGNDPIDGVAILQGQTPDLLMLRVRLPSTCAASHHLSFVNSSTITRQRCINTKGRYKAALAVEIAHFTCISDPYGQPLAPEVTMHANQENPGQSLEAFGPY
jgi:Adenylylsulphate kinase